MLAGLEMSVLENLHRRVGHRSDHGLQLVPPRLGQPRHDEPRLLGGKRSPLRELLARAGHVAALQPLVHAHERRLDALGKGRRHRRWWWRWCTSWGG